MAKFNVTWATDEYTPYTGLSGGSGAGETITSDDILACLLPAAVKLVDYYKQTIRRLFKRRTGNFEESIDFAEITNKGSALVRVKPFGRHRGSRNSRKSRAGPAGRKYAKHNRTVAADLNNEDLGYFLEYGTPRIAPTHWMENTNEEVEGEIQDIIEAEFNKLLDKKGL